MKVLFIINPTSGRTDNGNAIQIIQELADQEKFTYRFFNTCGDNDDDKIKNEIKSFSPDRIAACGGDGTVQLVARNLIEKNIPMGIIPLGSANGLATALEIPKDAYKATQIIIQSNLIIPLDLLLINDKYYCTHLSDIGTNALLVKNYEEAGDKGFIGYAKHLVSSIQQSDLIQFDIETNKGTCSKNGYMLTIANANKYGTGVQISEGSVSDGNFEICTVKKIDLESAIKAGLTAVNIIIDKDMFSDVITCREALINVTPKAHLQIDGEYIGEVNQVKVKLISSAIKVIGP